MAFAMEQTYCSKDLMAEESIEAIKSLCHLCSKKAHESMDNLLMDLYKKCRRLDEQIHHYKQKLRAIYLGEAFNERTTKTARSHETTRILGNLGWAYMQQNKYDVAEVVYRKAQQVKSDARMACNLGHCLIKKRRFDEAFHVLDDVVNFRFAELALDENRKILNRAKELMREMEEARMENVVSVEMESKGRLNLTASEWSPFRTRRLPILEEII